MTTVTYRMLENLRREKRRFQARSNLISLLHRHFYQNIPILYSSLGLHLNVCFLYRLSKHAKSNYLLEADR